MKCPKCENPRYRYKVKLDRDSKTKPVRKETETYCNKCKHEGNEPLMVKK